MSFTPPTVVDFQSKFDRDFEYGEGKETVRDIDISRALGEAAVVFNPTIWDETEQADAYLYAAAHFMVLDIQMAGGITKVKGIDSHGGGITQSKSVGQISVTYGIPPRILEDAVLNQFLRTDYGLRYLLMITPRLIGNIVTVSGRSPWADR